MWGRLASKAAGVFVIALTVSGTAGAQPATPTSTLIVCIVLSPQLSLGTRSGGIVLAEAGAIWMPLGVAIRRVDQPDESCQRVIVVKADHEARPEDVSRETALGWVPFVAGRARQLVFLRVARGRLLIDGLSPGTRPDGLTDLLHARLLGRSLAHELGHVLLNSLGHERSGLMRAHYRAGDVLRMPAASYTLNPAERARLFTQLSSSARLAVR